MKTALSQTSGKIDVRRGAIRWLIRETLGNLFLIAILFGVVGRWDWWMGWALVAVYITWTAATAIFILPVNAAMLAERARPHAGTKKWDMALLGMMGILVIVAYVIASLDVRWGWSPQFPLAVLGHDVLLVWAMVANAFFVATVRIQTDHNQMVVSSGPYRYVRHPGYAGHDSAAFGNAVHAQFALGLDSSQPHRSGSDCAHGIGRQDPARRIVGLRRIRRSGALPIAAECGVDQIG